MTKRKPDPRELILYDLRERVRELRLRAMDLALPVWEVRALNLAQGIIETVIADLEAQR